MSPAPVWRRFAALIYDSFILLALSMLYGAITTFVYVAIYGSGKGDYTPMTSGPFTLLGWILTLQAFYIFFWARAGQTVGMRAWRLKLVDKSNGKPALQSCIIRAFIAPFSLIVFGLGYFWAWLDSKGDCAHDKLSGTRVLFTPKIKSLKKNKK